LKVLEIPVFARHLSLATFLQNLSLTGQDPSQFFSSGNFGFFGHANQEARELALIACDVVEVSDLHMLWCMAKRYAFGTYVY